MHAASASAAATATAVADCFLLAGIEHSYPAPMRRSMSLSSPFDETFRLDAATGAHVAPGFDVDALERLLQRLEPLGRPIALDGFLEPEYRIYPPARNQSWMLKGFTDPELNELLAEVWQPFWATQPDEMLADPDCHYPGQALARRRRSGEP